jgi:ribosomal protein L11 methyltransferase
MNRSPEPAASLAPGPHLYIYCLRGRPGGLAAGEGFLGNWEEDEYSFLFFDRPARGRIDTLVAANPGVELFDESDMSYEQWQGGRIGTMTVAGFTLAPPWERPPPAGTPRLIVLDPGLVFGNGLHPTTRDCLAAIDLAAGQGPLQGAVDLGTGTGVLAIALARCGARRVLAVDNNPLCTRTAAANVRRNALQDRVLVVQGRAEAHAAGDADLMVANLHYAVMRRLLLAARQRCPRRLVLSGLLRSEAGKIADQLQGLGVRVLRQWVHDGIWHTFYGLRGRASVQSG